MIQSIFLVNQLGDIFLERHWKRIIVRNVLDSFFEAQSKVNSPDDISPVIPSGPYYLIHIYKYGIYFIAVVQGEAPPLFVIEFLHRVTNIITDYLQDCNESKIREKLVLVYEILEEMVDNGYPLSTEPNLIRELIRPSTIVSELVQTVTGKENIASKLPASQISNFPWRRANVKYVNNEFYMDITEEIDCIIDKSGAVVSCDIIGYVDCQCKLSGMPDLMLNFFNSRILEDVSFHPCVRYRRWEQEKNVSFIPPDGNFRLMTYQVSPQSSMTICTPISVTPAFSFKESAGHMDIRVTGRNTFGKALDDIEIICPMPKGVVNVNLVASQGTFVFDPLTKVIRWKVSRLIPGKGTSLSGSVSLAGGATKLCHPEISIHFVLPLLTISGNKVNRLQLMNENFKPYKGVKYMTRSGKFQVRS